MRRIKWSKEKRRKKSEKKRKEKKMQRGSGVRRYLRRHGTVVEDTFSTLNEYYLVEQYKYNLVSLHSLS